MTATGMRRVRTKPVELSQLDRSDWTAFGIYGVKYQDAMKAAADMRRETQRRLDAIDRFLNTKEDEFLAVTPDRVARPAIDALQKIREWFSGELEIACRALGLDSTDVGEKAAIYECDHGYPRRQAEIMALREFLQHFGRYDGKAKEIVEGGKILDIARRFLDDREMSERCRYLDEQNDETGAGTAILRYTKPQ